MKHLNGIIQKPIAFGLETGKNEDLKVHTEICFVQKIRDNYDDWLEMAKRAERTFELTSSNTNSHKWKY